MSVIFLILVLLAGYHFVYQGILLPSIRLKIRYDLYALRDRLRTLKINHPSELSDEAFDFVHASIVMMLETMPEITMSLLYTAKQELSADEHLNKRVSRRSKQLDDCTLDEVHTIMNSLVKTTGVIFLANSGGWLIYVLPLVPIAALGLLMVDVVTKIKGLLKQAILEFILIPKRNLDQMVAIKPVFGYE